MKKGPKIDGKGDDPVWGQACYLSDFKITFGNKAPVPASHATSVGILADKENLYFLLQAKEPDMKSIRAKGTPNDKTKALSDDAFEVFIAPPSNNFKYYQFVVNSNGGVVELEQPSNNMQVSLGATAKATRGKDGYVIELKVPVKKLADSFGDGVVWKIHAARNYRVGKLTQKQNFSLDGTGYHAVTAFRSMTIGTVGIRNGSFEEGLEKKSSRPKSWGTPGKFGKGIKLVKEGGNTLASLPANAILAQHIPGRFFKPAAPLKTILTFRAKGKGKLLVIDTRYVNRLNKKGKIYNQHLPHKTKRLATISLNGKEVIHTCEFTIDKGEFVTLLFRAGGEKGTNILLDDVSVRSAE